MFVSEVLTEYDLPGATVAVISAEGTETFGLGYADDDGERYPRTVAGNVVFGAGAGRGLLAMGRFSGLSSERYRPTTPGSVERQQRFDW